VSRRCLFQRPVGARKARPNGSQLASLEAVDGSGNAATTKPKTVAGKMHLWRFGFVGKNSMFSLPHRRNNFLFTRQVQDIYRK
jgi:hypothetical protein